jgi:hypothetical protein
VIRVFAGVAISSALVGAVAGVLCAVVLLAIISIHDHVSAGFADFELYRGAAIIGAGCGVVLGPSASFGFMRQVPLGRLFLETCVGTVLGGVAGFLLDLSFEAALAMAGIGFLLAGARLAWTHRAGAATPEPLPLNGQGHR